MEDRRRALLLLVFFLPSVMFWGSGVLKESIMLFGLGLLVYCFHRLITHGFTVKRLLFILLGLGILLVTKYYILAALITGLLANAWIYATGGRRPLLKYSIAAALLCVAGGIFISIKPQYDPLEILALKQKNFINLARGGAYVANDKILIYLPVEHKDSLVPAGQDSIFTIRKNTPLVYWKLENINDTLYGTSLSDTARYTLWWNMIPSGSRIQREPLQPTIGSFVKSIPGALANTFFRPHLLEARTPFMLMAAAENLIIFALLLICIFFFKPPSSPPLFWLSVSFVLTLFVLIGLVTPVLGALVRYKMPALPFLAAAMLMMIDTGKLEKRLPFMRRLSLKR